MISSDERPNADRNNRERPSPTTSPYDWDGLGPRRLLGGLVSDINTIASVRSYRVDGGPGDGMRVIEASVFEGFALRVLPDRGLDISQAWFKGTPIAWLSKVEESRPVLFDTENAWINSFSGGLLTTCGPDNVGLATAEKGLHGRWTFLVATDVSTERRIESDGEVSVHVSGVISDVHPLGRHIQVNREIAIRSSSGIVEVNDVITNCGYGTEALPLMYHINIGAPLWAPGAVLEFPEGSRSIPRDEYAASRIGDIDAAPTPQVGGQEYVVERILPDAGCRVILRNFEIGLEMCLRWRHESMPRFHQWIHPAKGVYVLGLEPANSSLAGRDADAAEGRLPILEAGESRTFGFTLNIGPIAPRPSDFDPGP